MYAIRSYYGGRPGARRRQGLTARGQGLGQFLVHRRVPELGVDRVGLVAALGPVEGAGQLAAGRPVVRRGLDDGMIGGHGVVVALAPAEVARPVQGRARGIGQAGEDLVAVGHGLVKERLGGQGFGQGKAGREIV